MKCAIMQPTYMPWAGYFNLIASVDTFVFLDDVQFDRRSWQSRNRIFDGGKVQWLSCAVTKASRETLIQNIHIRNEENWQQLHYKKIHLNYKNTPFFSELMPILSLLTSQKFDTLLDVNKTLISYFCQMLELDTKFTLASKLAAGGKRSEHLLAICEKINATDYLSPNGSKDYLMQDACFNETPIKLEFQQFLPATYQQYHTPNFVSHLSIIDVIANIGLAQTKQYIKGNYKL